jgi:hypothetical protein
MTCWHRRCDALPAMKAAALLFSLALLSGSAFAAPLGGPTREQIGRSFSAKALKLFDRATRTGGRGGSSQVIVSQKDNFSQRINSRGRRTDISTLAKGQYSSITAVQRERGGVREQVTRNYRERSLLGKILRIESTVGYRLKYMNGGDAQKQLLKNEKRLVLGGILRIPLPGDGKRILGTLR